MAKRLDNVISVSLTEEQFQFLKDYCFRHDITYSKALRRFVQDQMNIQDSMKQDLPFDF